MKLINTLTKGTLFGLAFSFFSVNAIAQPTLNTPSAGATDLNVSFLIAIGSFPSATSYDIELSHDGSYTGSSPQYQAQLTSTKRTFSVDSLDYGHTYFARWRADNSGYDNTTFTTKSSPITWAKITNGTNITEQTLDIFPKGQPMVDNWDWQFDTTTAFNSAVRIDANTLTSNNSGAYTFDQDNFLDATTYYVRVRGNVTGQALTGDWATDIRNFNTAAGNAAPTLNTPSEGATGLNATFTIGIGTGIGSVSYDMELSHDGSYTGSSPQYQAQLASTSRSMTVDSLDYGHTYFFRWRGDNTQYGSTTFSTKSGPVTWAQITNGTTITEATYEIPAKQEHMVTRYRWQFDTAATFDSPALIFDSTDATVNNGTYTYDQSNFITGVTYYVRNQGYVGSQSLYGAWATDVRNFNTDLVAAPTLNTPSDQDTVDLNFLIAIGAVTGASTYDIELSDDSTFTGGAPGYQSQLANASRTFNITGLSTNSTYHLRWRANNSEYGTATVFTSAQTITTEANIVDGTYFNAQNTEIGLNPAQPSADDYVWQFDTVATFTSGALISDTVPRTSNNGRYQYDADNFISGQQYYVRINILVGGTPNGWGATHDFYSTLHEPLITFPTGTVNRVAMKLKCEVAENATDYEIEYANNASFTGSTTVTPNRDWYVPGGWNPVGVITIKAYDYVSGLDYNTNYYVRARAWNANQSTSSPSQLFNTGLPNVQITTVNDGDTIPINYWFGMSYIAGATDWEVQIDDNPGFTSVTKYPSTTTGVSVNGLANDQQYYARTRCRIGGTWYGSSASSIAFRTVAAAKFGDTFIDGPAEVVIYPNPSHDVFNVYTPEGKTGTMVVTDATGSVVSSGSVGAGTTQIGAGLNPGVYIVDIAFEDGSRTIKRLIKN